MQLRPWTLGLLLAAASRAGAVPKAPDPQSPLDTAKVLMGKGSYAEALKFVDSYKAKGEAESRRVFVKARILALKGDRDQARAQLKDAFRFLPGTPVTSDTVLELVDAIEGETDFAKLRDDLDFEAVRATALGTLQRVIRDELARRGAKGIGEHKLYTGASGPLKSKNGVCVSNPMAAHPGAGRCPPDQCAFGLIVVKRVAPVGKDEKCHGVPVEI